MSEKNKLQEYCQKNQLSMPIYDSWSVGEHHKPNWSANISIIMNGKKITMNTTVPTNTKTNAEKQAASLLLDFLQKDKLHIIKIESKKAIISDNNYENNNDISNIINANDVEKECNFTVYPQEIYLIDLENKPIFNHRFKENALYIGFLNSIHHSIKKYTDWYKCQNDNICKEILKSKCNRLIYLIEGGTADLVDHFMSALIYPILDFIQLQNIFPKIIIVSGDHAGWCTRACLERVLKWKKILGIEIENTIL